LTPNGQKGANAIYAHRQHSFITPGGHFATFEYREDTSDWNTLTASISEDEYHLKGREITGHALDIGGYLGSVGICLAIDHPEITVTILEPVPDNVELIGRNIELNGLTDRVNVIHGAAGAKGRKKIRVHYGFRGTESGEHHAFVGNANLFQDQGSGSDCPQFIDHDHADVRVYSLAELLPADFIKIDCEGGEWNFMAKAPTAKVRQWVGEWHPIPGHNDGQREPGDTQAEFAALLPGFDIRFDGPLSGAAEFSAVLR
jgi:FkbM family methyltransferase